MKFGLILCTVNRKFEIIDNFIKSLLRNNYDDWELIIVDQNTGFDIYNSLSEKYLELINNSKIKYFHVKFRGLSKARNFGIQLLESNVDIIAFPDDDCEYPHDLLEKIEKIFQESNLDFITGRSIDKFTGVESNGKWLKKDTWLNLGNIWNGAISYTIFIKNGVKINFDERLGVGSGTPFGSGEETDLLIRLIKEGFKGKYFKDVYVYHPSKSLDDFSRVKFYAMGMGGVFKKNFSLSLSFLKSFLNLMIVRPLGGALLHSIKFDFNSSNAYFLTFYYRWKGFLFWTNYKSSNHA